MMFWAKKKMNSIYIDKKEIKSEVENTFTFDWFLNAFLTG